jgi:hypothetical protein
VATKELKEARKSWEEARLPLCLPHCVSDCVSHLLLPLCLPHCVSDCVSHLLLPLCLPQMNHLSHCVFLIISQAEARIEKAADATATMTRARDDGGAPHVNCKDPFKTPVELQAPF